ncbi:MAG: response regulator [Planctomycetota bacterium]
MSFDKDVLTTGEVAKICNVAPRTVSKWFDSGQLNGYRIPGSKDRRIPVGALMQFMKDHNIPLDGIMSGKTRVLVVDDEHEVTGTLSKVLAEQGGYDVIIADSAFEAGVYLERFKPHVMLLDLHISDGDATHIADLVDSSEEFALTRVIAMSGKVTDGQAMSLRQQGFEAVLKKPFQVRSVIEQIEKAASPIHH